MSEKDILDMLKETKIPVYRGHAPIGTSVPYMVLNIRYPDNFGADNVVYARIPQYQIDLYQNTPSQTVRESVESKLTENGFYYSEDEADMEEQNLYITYYYFGGLNNGR